MTHRAPVRRRRTVGSGLAVSAMAVGAWGLVTCASVLVAPEASAAPTSVNDEPNTAAEKVAESRRRDELSQKERAAEDAERERQEKEAKQAADDLAAQEADERRERREDQAAAVQNGTAPAPFVFQLPPLPFEIPGVTPPAPAVTAPEPVAPPVDTAPPPPRRPRLRWSTTSPTSSRSRRLPSRRRPSRHLPRRHRFPSRTPHRRAPTRHRVPAPRRSRAFRRCSPVVMGRTPAPIRIATRSILRRRLAVTTTSPVSRRRELRR